MEDASSIDALMVILTMFLAGPLIAYLMAALVGAKRLPAIAAGVMLSLGSLLTMVVPGDYSNLVATVWTTCIFSFLFGAVGYLIGKASQDEGGKPHVYAARGLLIGAFVSFLLATTFLSLRGL